MFDDKTPVADFRWPKIWCVLIAGLVFFLISAAYPPASAEEVGEVGVDWLGNDIIIEALEDPKVAGVTGHIAYFERGLIDRFQKGNWFEDPSNSSIDCSQTGAITIGEIEQDKDGEEIFKNARSLIWKKLVVKRIFDEKNNTLIYLAHSRKLQDGSAKMSISVMPLLTTTTVFQE